MHSLVEKWPAMPDWSLVSISTSSLSVRVLTELNQLLISGGINDWANHLGISEPYCGAFDTVVGERYGVRLARDRILAVSNAPFSIRTGWHSKGYAITPVDAGLLVFEVAGTATSAVLARATSVPSNDRSASAAISFAGTDAVVYWHRKALRVHIERSLAPYVWHWLKLTSDTIEVSQTGQSSIIATE